MTQEQNPPTILVVDDTPSNLQLLESLLQGEGFRVLEFLDGKAALEAARKTSPDLVLLDIMMPSIGGFEVCRQLKSDESLRHIPVLFMSALDDTDNKVRAFAEGGVDYITKPIQEEEVLARVRTHLQIGRQQREIHRQREMYREQYEALQALEAQRDQLIHMIVHDMRAPLTGVIGYAEMLATGLRKAENVAFAERAERLVHASQTLRDMITMLLDINRLETDAFPFHPAPTDLGTVIREAVQNLGALTHETRLEADLPSSPIEVHCDGGVVSRVLQNLLVNAIKHTGAGGAVCIGLAASPAEVRISITDTGEGIPAEYHGRIFDKFGQVDARKAGQAHSSGLGLTFCKLAVEAQGGCIGVESTPGEGSTFWFTLPTSAAGCEASASACVG